MPFADLPVALAAALAGGPAALAVGPALLPTHGVGSRADLPLPFTALVVGATLALIASFAGLGLLWRTPRLTPTGGIPLARGLQRAFDSRALRTAGRAAALLLTGWVLLALVAGQDVADNPVPYVVYVWLWVGLPVLSLLLGPVWTTLNPLRLLHLALTRAARLDPDEALVRAHPGRWPAALLLLCFTWLELVADDRTSLPVLRVAILAFGLVEVIGALALGRAWFAVGDPFEVLSRTYATLSPLGRRADGRVVLRSPVRGPSLEPARRGGLAVVSVLLGSTAYDSLSSSIRYAAWVQTTSAPTAVRTLVLVATCALVGGALAAASAAAAALGRAPLRGAAAALAPSLIPVAAGYLVAHYWSLFVYQGQRTLVLLSDPLGTGADLLHTAGLQPGQALLAPGLVAVVQASAIVLGHVLGVVVAHERALRLVDPARAVVSQLPLMGLMLLYTVGGLSLLFAA